MPYKFDEVCQPNFEFFEYHRAEQREFDFVLTHGIFEIFGQNGRELAEAVSAEESRIHASFQDHARHMTSCVYRRLLRGYEIPASSGPDAPEYVSGLYENYVGLIAHRCLTPEHADELGLYISELFSFAGLQSPDDLPEGAH